MKNLNPLNIENSELLTIPTRFLIGILEDAPVEHPEDAHTNLHIITEITMAGVMMDDLPSSFSLGAVECWKYPSESSWTFARRYCACSDSYPLSIVKDEVYRIAKKIQNAKYMMLYDFLSSLSRQDSRKLAVVFVNKPRRKKSSFDGMR